MKKLVNTAKCLCMAVALLSVVSAYAQMHVTPAPGRVTELSEFLITFDGSWSLEDRKSKFVVTAPEGVTVPKIMSYSQGASVGYSVYFEDDAVLTTPGTYTLTVPAGKFGFDGTLNEETVYEYTIVAPGENPELPEDVYAGEVMAYPTPGPCEKITGMVLGFEGIVEVVNPDAVGLAGPDGLVPVTVAADEDMLVVNVDNEDGEVTDPGTYVLHVSADALTIDGKRNPALAYTYVISDEAADTYPAYSIDPAPGTYKAINDGFRLTFNTDQEITLARNSVFMMTDNGVSVELFAEVPLRMPYIQVIPIDAKGDPIALDVAGHYTLVFTMGSVRINGTSNQEPLVFDYHVTGSSGIEAIQADSADKVIYTTSGVKVPDASRAAHGIYIIDGKKQILK